MGQIVNTDRRNFSDDVEYHYKGDCKMAEKGKKKKRRNELAKKRVYHETVGVLLIDLAFAIISIYTRQPALSGHI